MSIFYTIKSTIGTDNPIYTDNDSPFYFTPCLFLLYQRKALSYDLPPRFTAHRRKKIYLVTAYAHIE